MNESSPLKILKSYVAGFASIPDEELAAFVRAHASLVDYRKGSRFIGVGDSHDRLGFVVRGLFRVYYQGPKGAYHVRNFCKEGMPIGAYGTVIAGRPSNVAIEAIETSRVLEFPYGALAAQFERGAAWERLGRRIAEEHYVSRERREHALLTLDAKARLERFQQDFPELVSRLKGVDVASYIRVRPETLSRMLRRTQKA